MTAMTSRAQSVVAICMAERFPCMHTDLDAAATGASDITDELPQGPDQT